MNTPLKVRDVFKSLGVPTLTYVRRENGRFESELADALDTRGKLALLTGPSKTGKTTLYSRVLEERNVEPLTVRCDADLTSEEFWRRALERVNFERLASLQDNEARKVSAGAKLGGKIGWAWLAGLLGEVNVGVEKSMGEVEIREKILSKPSPHHLVPILKALPLVMVVEDFHYLIPKTKEAIFQQWKVFVDSEVSVIVVGTTHHAVDLAYANRDLVGRIAQIDLSTWNTADLEKIATLGFTKLGVKADPLVTTAIAREAVGLPIIVQEACAQALLEKGWSEVEPGKVDIALKRSDAETALHKVATLHYRQFEIFYDRLATGPRKAARKYNTYELVLLAFAKDPLVFSLKRHEIDERLKSIPLPDPERPPPASINSMLKALAKFQQQNGIELLDWSTKEQRLYILEPAFLFYLRWREIRKGHSALKDLLETFFHIKLNFGSKAG
ncbi:AAA family ATPase [Amphibiibacter pelophylacis]|uniref:AAA family ATPase n=1 Tax=Amphibiibacter pelophylacis TaxID=1799477 RepID=A0ACC6P1N5_9BURK